jgi:predicted nuclease with TOPRIM domain
MILDFLQTNWDNLILAIGGIGAFFGGRKLKQIDEKKAGSDALNSMQLAYNEFVIDQKERYKELKEELIYVRGELKSVKEESKSLREEVQTWKTKYNSLKKEFDRYRKSHQ